METLPSSLQPGNVTKKSIDQGGEGELRTFSYFVCTIVTLCAHAWESMHVNEDLNLSTSEASYIIDQMCCVNYIYNEVAGRTQVILKNITAEI